MNTKKRLSIIVIPYLFLSSIIRANRYAGDSLLILIVTAIVQCGYYTVWSVITWKNKQRSEFITSIILLVTGIIIAVWCCKIHLSGLDSGGHLIV